MSIKLNKKDKKTENTKLDMADAEERESSFRNTGWPSSLPSADFMADAGFYFTPNEKYSDCCTCYKCGVKMFNWLPDDTPRYEHKKFSPSCKEVKSWTVAPIDDSERQNLNRAEQVEHTRFRTRVADKAKRLTGSLHKKSDVSRPSIPFPSMSKEAEMGNAVSSETGRELNDEEKLADIRRQREVAERSLEGLEKLSSFYHPGSVEQKRAEQSIVLQSIDLEKLREEENRLAATMGTLSFGRTWGAAQQTSSTTGAQSAVEEEDSPVNTRSRSNSRPLPKLPSQLIKDTVPRNPAHIGRSNVTPLAADNQFPSLAEHSKSTSSQAQEEWIEYFTEQGVPYYYNTASKKTVWQIPSSNDILQPVYSN